MENDPVRPKFRFHKGTWDDTKEIWKYLLSDFKDNEKYKDKDGNETQYYLKSDNESFIFGEKGMTLDNIIEDDANCDWIGYSLGGMICSVGLYMFYRYIENLDYKGKICLYRYAAPKVINNEAEKYLIGELKEENYFSIVNYKDIFGYILENEGDFNITEWSYWKNLFNRYILRKDIKREKYRSIGQQYYNNKLILRPLKNLDDEKDFIEKLVDNYSDDIEK